MKFFNLLIKRVGTVAAYAQSIQIICYYMKYSFLYLMHRSSCSRADVLVEKYFGSFFISAIHIYNTFSFMWGENTLLLRTLDILGKFWTFYTIVYTLINHSFESIWYSVNHFTVLTFFALFNLFLDKSYHRFYMMYFCESRTSLD